MECAYQSEIMNNPHAYTFDRELSYPINYPVVEWPAAEKIITSGQLDSINCAAHSSSSSQFISFGYPNFCPPEIEKFNYGAVNCGGAMGLDRDKDFSFLKSQSSDENQNCYLIGNDEGHKIKKAAIMDRRDHVIAERRRREKLSQKFVALSALIPGLKKVKVCSKFWSFY